MTKKLHKSIFYISSEYIDLWSFFVIKHLLKDKKELKFNQITISSCSVYLSGRPYTMDRALQYQTRNLKYKKGFIWTCYTMVWYTAHTRGDYCASQWFEHGPVNKTLNSLCVYWAMHCAVVRYPHTHTVVMVNWHLYKLLKKSLDFFVNCYLLNISSDCFLLKIASDCFLLKIASDCYLHLYEW